VAVWRPVLLANAILEWQEYAVSNGHVLVKPKLPVVRRYLIVGEVLVRPRARCIEATNIPAEWDSAPIDHQGSPLVSEEA